LAASQEGLSSVNERMDTLEILHKIRDHVGDQNMDRRKIILKGILKK
jgi:hypothetical protein